MKNYKNLTFEQLPEVLEKMESFTLSFHEEDGAKKDYHWVTENELVSAFKSAIDYAHTEPAYISALAQHHGYIRTTDDQVYRFGLYNIDENNNGYLIIAGRPIPLHSLMRSVIKRSFRLARYSSATHFLSESPETSGSQDAGGDKDHNPGYPLPKGKDYQYTVILYSDNGESDHNQKFALEYRDTYETELKKVVIFKATGPNQANSIKSKIKSGKIRRILYAVHGAEAVFNTKYSSNLDSASNVGLYPKNTIPKTFALALNDLKDVVEKDASLLLLSCSTAGETEYRRKILNGKDIVLALANDAKLTVYAADQSVFITATPPRAYIKQGSIYCAAAGDKRVSTYGSQDFPITTSFASLDASFEYLEEGALA
jgi:hypothetical protein